VLLLGVVELHLRLIGDDFDFGVLLANDDEQVVSQHFCSCNLTLFRTAENYTLSIESRRKSSGRTLCGCRAVSALLGLSAGEDKKEWEENDTTYLLVDETRPNSLDLHPCLGLGLDILDEGAGRPHHLCPHVEVPDRFETNGQFLLGPFTLHLF
jgi:hypothetical protein